MGIPSSDRLIEILESGNAVLIAGAGSSRIAGYPVWGTFIDQLHTRVAPEEMPRGDGESVTDFAQRIKNRAIHEGRSMQYYKGLERAFDRRAGDGHEHDRMHELLVNLGFRALCTTNYDEILEDACISVMKEDDQVSVPECEPIDLCDKSHRWRVLPFLRNLPKAGSVHNAVLHLHGFFKHPEGMVVTTDDYVDRYGYRQASETEPPRQVATLHRKILWTLAAAHPLVFVGFSLEDEYFTQVLSLVNEDFQLEGDLVHFALYGSKSEDRDRITRALNRYGTEPVFYETQEQPDGTSDHSRLTDLLMKIADSLGTISPAVGSKSVFSSITDQFLDDL